MPGDDNMRGDENLESVDDAQDDPEIFTIPPEGFDELPDGSVGDQPYAPPPPAPPAASVDTGDRGSDVPESGDDSDDDGLPPRRRDLDDDVFAGVEPLVEPSAFAESAPTPDEIDELFSGAIASQVAEQERITALLEEVRDDVARLADQSDEELTDRIAILSGRFSLLEQRLEDLGDRISTDLAVAHERSAEVLRDVREGSPSRVDDRLTLVEARLESLVGRLEESRVQARAHTDELLAAFREPPETDDVDEQMEALTEGLARLDEVRERLSGLDTLAERVDDLAESVVGAQQAAAAVPDEVATRLAASGEQQLARLESAIASPTESLAQRMGHLEGRIEQLASGIQAESATLGQVHRGIDELGSALSGEGPTSLASMGARLGSLNSQLDELARRVSAQFEALEPLQTSLERIESGLTDGLGGQIAGLGDSLRDEASAIARLHDEVERLHERVPADSRPALATLTERVEEMAAAVVEMSAQDSQVDVLNRLAKVRGAQRELKEGVDEIRGDLASQYGAQSARVLAELDDRLARVEGAVAEVAQSVVSSIQESTTPPDELREQLAAVIEGVEERLSAELAATRELEERTQHRVEEAATEQQSAVTARLGEMHAALHAELQEQRAALLTSFETAALDAGESSDAVAQLRGTVAAMADDIADAVSSANVGVTRGDIEALELAIARVTSGGDDEALGRLERQLAEHRELVEQVLSAVLNSDDEALTRIEAQLAEHTELVEQLPDALERLRGTVEQAPSEAAETVAAAADASRQDLQRLADEVRAAMQQATERIDQAVEEVGQGTASLGQQADAALTRVADVLAEEGNQGRAKLREAGRALGEAMERVQSLEAAMVDYLGERDAQIANERSMIAAELSSLLADGLSKRDRRKIAKNISQGGVIDRAHPGGGGADPSPPREADELAPSQRARRPLSRAEDADPQRRPAAPGRQIVGPASAKAAARAAAGAGRGDSDAAADEPASALSSGPAAPKRPTPRGGPPVTEEDRAALSEIKGVGPARQDLLLEAFGSVVGIAEADIEDLVEIPGITERLARDIKQWATKRTR